MTDRSYIAMCLSDKNQIGSASVIATKATECKQTCLKLVASRKRMREEGGLPPAASEKVATANSPALKQVCSSSMDRDCAFLFASGILMAFRGIKS